MTTATEPVEQTEAEKLNEAIMNFKMPGVTLGKEVLWYRLGQIGPQAEVAFVIKKGERNIRIRTAGGLVVDAVRHIDDPKLAISVEQRTSGAWDFTEDHKAAFARLDTLEAQVKALTTKVEEFIAPAPKSKKAE